MAAFVLVGPQPVTIGSATLLIDSGDSFYFNPDSSWPYFSAADGKTKIAMWGPGRPTRYSGPNLDALAQSGPCPTPVTRASGVGSGWDSAGTWMLAANRASDGTLVALTHVEDHSFADGGVGEWNSSGIWTSKNDGRSWTNLGQICGEAKPAKARYGGLDMRVMIWNSDRKAWLGYCGAYAFESKDRYGAPGTWYGYYDGGFSQKIDPSQPAPALSELPGLSNSGPQAVTWGSLSWNRYFKKYLYIWRAAGAKPKTVYYALSSDGLRWETPEIFLTEEFAEGQSLDYPTLVGDSSSQTGQDDRLIYAQTPSTGLRRKDMVERWIHFGPLSKPTSPERVEASGEPGWNSAVTVSWKGVAAADTYRVFRQEARVWKTIGTVRSSSAVPHFVDREAKLGQSYAYRVDALNAAGASGASRSAVGSAAPKWFRLLNPRSGLALEAGPEGKVTLMSPGKGDARQAWKFLTQDGRTYRIVNQATGQALSGPPVPVTPGTLVSIAALQNSGNQDWSIEPTGPTLALIQSGLCLDGFGEAQAPGTSVDLYPYGGKLNQQWKLERVYGR